MKEKKKQDHRKLFDDAPQAQKIRADFPVTHGAARHTDPETSKAAARNVKASGIALNALRCLYKNGDRTTEEISEITGDLLASVTPRMKALVIHLLVRKTGKTRPGASGAQRDIYQITDLGRDYVIRSIDKGE